MKILVTGAGGMLGRRFLDYAGSYKAVGVGRTELDMSAPAAIGALVAAHQPDVVVNCAADTDVEGAEKRSKEVFAVNSTLPEILAAACNDIDAIMVQISSTGCYGNWKTTPYVEDDPLHPTTMHHKAKAQGEIAVRTRARSWMIVRTGWLYGAANESPKNFVRSRLKEARDSAVMLSDAGQFGNPTFAGDVAAQVYKLLEKKQCGIFNCVARGDASRLEYVRAIVDAAGIACDVQQAPPGYFRRAAAVSANERALNARLDALGLGIMPEWRAALENYVRQLTP